MILWGLKHLIITGGTGGLGKSIAEQFEKAGWKVSALGRKDLDLNDASGIITYFSENPCDLLICAAGMIHDQPLAKMDESTWDEIIHINYTAAKQCALAAIPKMIQQGGGHVIFISSYAANHPTVGQAAYATAKAQILGITRDFALANGSNNIRVNAILPGFMDTPMTESVSIRRKQEVRESHVMGEFNSPQIVAEFIHFLEERMPHTSGQVFQLDSRPSP
jgi:3-oxoacyl-[acyl-carrier protein] reductase